MNILYRDKDINQQSILKKKKLNFLPTELKQRFFDSLNEFLEIEKFQIISLI